MKMLLNIPASAHHLRKLTRLLLVSLLLIGSAASVARFMQARQTRLADLVHHHEVTWLRLEAEMQTAINTVDGLHAFTQAYYSHNHLSASLYDAMLVARPDKGGYALEPPSNVNLANVPHLSGIGDLNTLDASLRREISMALGLTPLFQWAKQTHPTAPWVYYTSARLFGCYYPYTPPDDIFFAPEFLLEEFFTGGLPERNPDRRAFITHAYQDPAGQGLIVTIARPVDEGAIFRRLSWFCRSSCPMFPAS